MAKSRYSWKDGENRLFIVVIRADTVFCEAHNFYSYDGTYVIARSIEEAIEFGTRKAQIAFQDVPGRKHSNRSCLLAREIDPDIVVRMRDNILQED